MTDPVTTVLVYIKDECHLCDALLANMRTAIENMAPGERPRVVIRDIEDRDDWYARYREYVPVIVINDEEVCHYFFDQQEFEQALQ